ncbi:hypothetical protein A2Z33_02325 [Candidatus Gottesmanbacteria bacterium RBG_16_52_11]|uniref:Pilus assembly protein PilO n=1 Tax=Candidatus Gottesmanbacteria bacterium RBG_16_52_11 TaxID=1798374 RepID=A0A1F5YN87_9BACT|nr:MAG: hypothetical protein A2Z33_02325 [Candidatus Gottesmanbacteria bacterium RBG_16_52_11]
MNENDNLPTQNKYQKFRRYYRSIEPVFDRPRTRVYTAIIFSFLAISLFGWYAIRPTIQTILHLQREIEDKSKLNAQMEQKIADLIEVQSAYELAKPLLYLVTEAVPVNSEPLNAVTQVRNLVATTEATMSSIQVAAVPLVSSPSAKPRQTAAEDKNEFPATAMLSGNYESIEQFLKGILTMRRIISIQHISLHPDEQSSDQTDTGIPVQLTVQMRAYYRP